MAPARRARGAHRAAAAAPYSLAVPDDALSAVLARLDSAVDLVRSACTCRHWARVVAKHAAVLSRVLPPLPCLTLGFIHQESESRPRPRRRGGINSAPCFVPTARLQGLSWMLDARGLLFERAAPVAARNGWLVLQLRQERYTDGLKLCVCNLNPTRGRGDLALLPPLAGADSPGDYACALYTGHDLDPPRPLSPFFRLLIVYNQRNFTAMRCYSSDTQSWTTSTARSTRSKIPAHTLRELGQSIVVRGVAYWPLRRSAFAVRLDTPEPAEVPMPPTGILDIPPAWRALGMDASGNLIYIDAAVVGDLGKGVTSGHLAVATRAVFCPGTGEDPGEWRPTISCIRMEQLKVRPSIKEVPPFGETVNLRWFCEKSGTLIFTLGKGCSSPGAFVLHMATKHLQKVAHGVECDSWRNVVGYEMDGAAYLASIARH